MMSEVSVLEVFLYEKPIATLTCVPGDRTLFAFNEAYIEDESRPVLGLSFKDSLGGLITEFTLTQTRVMPFLSNLLPEGHMRSYLAERAGVSPQREFFLLWALGQDLPGAITIKPAEGEDWPPEADQNEDHKQQEAEREKHALRFSLAGVQLKFSAINESSGGLTIPAKGMGGSWIVKLPSGEFAGVPENEYSMMTLARLVGVNVPAIKLIDPAEIQNLPGGIGELNGKAFAIERFDRLSKSMQVGMHVHMEDFAQVFGVYPNDKYKRASVRSIASVLAAETSATDIAEFVRRLTFNTLIGNADMHLKNWSLMYPDRRKAALAPAYDFVSTIAYVPDENFALKYSRTRRFDEFSVDELTHLAARAQLPQTLVIETARETVALFYQYWKSEKANLPLTAKVIRAIEAHVKTIPLAN
jgi:serine/threonine-protein kinase HipA